MHVAKWNLTRSTPSVAWLVVFPLLATLATAAAAQHGKVEKLKEPIGFVTSLTPCGTDTGAPKDVTFTAKTSFVGVSGEKITITLTLTVRDEAGKEVCKKDMSWVVESGEQGCINCPVSCPQTGLKAGSYVLLAVLTDKHADGTTHVLDAKTCVYELKK